MRAPDLPIVWGLLRGFGIHSESGAIRGTSLLARRSGRRSTRVRLRADFGISSSVSVHADPVLPSPVMVLGGKTLLWRENGIVFLRPPQAAAFPDARGSQGAVSSPAAASSGSSTSGCRHYPAEITFLPVVATSSFLPYLGTPHEKGGGLARRRRRISRQRGWSGPNRGETEHRDEVVKSVGRLKIIQGSSLRADALVSLADEQPAPLAISARVDHPLAAL